MPITITTLAGPIQRSVPDCEHTAWINSFEWELTFGFDYDNGNENAVIAYVIIGQAMLARDVVLAMFGKDDVKDAEEQLAIWYQDYLEDQRVERIVDQRLEDR